MLRSLLPPVCLILLACGDGGVVGGVAGGAGDGATATIEFSLMLEDGTIIDTNVGKEPLEVEIGSGRMLPAVEEALRGLAPGDTTQLVLSPDQAYGEIDPELLQSVPLQRIPEEARKVDMVVIGTAPDGSQRPLRVVEVGESEITLDLNHPLAGRTLTYDLKVLAVD